MVKSVYIHIPFCEKKCYYCDFNSYTLNEHGVNSYLEALEQEMKILTEAFPPNNIETIFIGGGTPTVLSPTELSYLFTIINLYFPNRSKEIEFSIEVNPGTLTREKLIVMKEYGINRLSIGVQAFQDELLSYIGRIHTEADVYQSIDEAIKQGFDNINIDIMFGLPKQTINMLKTTLKKAISLGLQHYSIYSLKVEENTVFYKLQEKNQLPLPTEEAELEMYLLTIEEMEKHGYKQYEISNFALENYQSKHNINYWKNNYYYGLGAGAHGYINNMRYENIKGIQPYIDRLKKENMLPTFEQYQVTSSEKMENMMMLGLRMINGVSFADFRRNFDLDMEEVFGKQITKLTNAGLINKDKYGIRLSAKGLIFGNEVFAEFISI